MSDPDSPKNNGNGNGNLRLTPSGSSVASSFGGSLAVIIVFIFHAYGINFPAGVEAAIAVLITTVAGYLPTSGRR